MNMKELESVMEVKGIGGVERADGPQWPAYG